MITASILFFFLSADPIRCWYNLCVLNGLLNYRVSTSCVSLPKRKLDNMLQESHEWLLIGDPGMMTIRLRIWGSPDNFIWLGEAGIWWVTYNTNSSQASVTTSASKHGYYGIPMMATSVNINREIWQNYDNSNNESPKKPSYLIQTRSSVPVYHLTDIIISLSNWDWSISDVLRVNVEMLPFFVFSV